MLFVSQSLPLSFSLDTLRGVKSLRTHIHKPQGERWHKGETSKFEGDSALVLANVLDRKNRVFQLVPVV